MSFDQMDSDERANLLAAVNRMFGLKERPTGDFAPDLLRRVTESVPQPARNEAIVQNLFLSLEPANRVWIGNGEDFLPPVAVGDVMRGAGIGKVIASNTRKFPIGFHVLGVLG